MVTHRLFTQMKQSDKTFAAWFPKSKGQPDMYVDANYTDNASRDTILYQTTSKKLWQKILSEDLSLDDTFKMKTIRIKSNKKKYSKSWLSNMNLLKKVDCQPERFRRKEIQIPKERTNQLHPMKQWTFP